MIDSKGMRHNSMLNITCTVVWSWLYIALDAEKRLLYIGVHLMNSQQQTDTVPQHSFKSGSGLAGARASGWKPILMLRFERTGFVKWSPCDSINGEKRSDPPPHELYSLRTGFWERGKGNMGSTPSPKICPHSIDRKSAASSA